MASAEELNQDLALISKWAYSDPSKQAEEIIYSRKRNCRDHPLSFFNNFEVKRVSDHKNLGLILDSKLTLVKHINENIAAARKSICVIKHISPYLPYLPYKMHVRPHLDYCDIIYHIPIFPNEFDSSQSLNYQINALERTQYKAALAVSGAWEGANLNKLYEELGWKTLTHRRLVRRLTQFYKTMNNLTPEYSVS